jgi:hypothetical protein
MLDIAGNDTPASEPKLTAANACHLDVTSASMACSMMENSRPVISRRLSPRKYAMLGSNAACTANNKHKELSL